MIIDSYKIRRLKKTLSGKRIFLIGNGPSVKISDLETLKGEVAFCANRFHLCYDQTEFRPTLTFLEDRKMIEHHLLSVAQSCETPLLIPNRLSTNKVNHPNLLRYAFLTQEEEGQVENFSSDLEEGLYSGGAVVYGMFQVAAFLEAKEIILYGVDHDFKIPLKKSSNGKHVIDTGESNHFIQGYRKKEEEWCPPHYEEINQGFQLARNYFQSRGVEVYNATRGGALEIFERKPLEDFFKKNSLPRERDKKKVLFRSGVNLNEKEKDFFQFLETQGCEVSLSSQGETTEDYKSYDLVITSDHPSLSPIAHDSSYFFLSQAVSSFLHPPGGFLFKNQDFLRALLYYDGILVCSQAEKSMLLDLKVTRPIYVLGAH